VVVFGDVVLWNAIEVVCRVVVRGRGVCVDGGSGSVGREVAGVVAVVVDDDDVVVVIAVSGGKVGAVGASYALDVASLVGRRRVVAAVFGMVVS